MATLPSHKLLHLPKELMQGICDYLGDKRSRRHLDAFSRASTACYAAASPALFKSIRLTTEYKFNYQPIRDTDHVAALVAEWHALLARREAHKHVRKLTVTEKHVPDDPGGFAMPPPANHSDTWDVDDEFADPPERPSAMLFGLYDLRRSSWKELEELVRCLPALVDFHWDSSWPLSGTMEDVVRSRPTLNLHLDTFSLQDDVEGEDLRRPALPPLLTLRQLRSIRVRSVGYTYNGGEDYTNETIVGVTAGVNPAVRHLSLLTNADYLREPVLARFEQGVYRKPWPGFTSPPQHLTESASLKSLELGGDLPTDLELLESVFRKCDLSQLATLKLRMPYDYPGLHWIASHAALPRLKVLVLGSMLTALPGSETGDQNPAAMLLNALPPLYAVRLIGDIYESIFKSILQRHGASLRRLWFPPPKRESEIFFTAERVGDLQRACPLLEDLVISIPRSHGDATEVGIYRSLGLLPRLRRLALTLDCEDMALELPSDAIDSTSGGPSFDAFDRECLETRHPDLARPARKGHLCRAITNAALDERLARQIFYAIAAAKPQFPDTLQLQLLELRPARGAYISEAIELINLVSKWWLLETYSTCSSNAEPIATRIRSPGDVDDEYGWPPPRILKGQLESIFRKIWPGKTSEESGWNDDWSSLPLAT